MNRWITRLAALALVGVVLLAAAAPAAAQGLWYREVEKDGRIYVFNTEKKYKEWLVSNDMGVAITMLGQGPNGETVIAENENAIDLYNLKHDRPGYSRPVPKPASTAIAPPTLLRWGTEGELKFGLNLQAWYIGDDSPYAIPPAGGSAPTNATLGNYIGANTFRLRRAEIKLYGKVNGSWGYEVMFDPAKAIVSTANAANPNSNDAKILQDLAVAFTGLRGWEFALGQKKITLTEEGVRSSSELDFPERSQITRAISDRREAGVFVKGDVIEPITVWSSITNGTISNSLDDSNDTVRFCGRVDLKFVPGLNFGGSGCQNGGDTAAHIGQTRIGGHARYNGGGGFPLIAEGEYYYAKDGRAGNLDLRRSGFYVQGLYTFIDMIQAGARYDEITRDLNAQNGENGVTQSPTGTKIKTWTFGVHWIPLGHDRYKNVSLKLDWFKVQEDGRLVNGVLADSYNQFLVAAQVAF
jgi:hypothetical protein